MPSTWSNLHPVSRGRGERQVLYYFQYYLIQIRMLESTLQSTFILIHICKFSSRTSITICCAIIKQKNQVLKSFLKKTVWSTSWLQGIFSNACWLHCGFLSLAGQPSGADSPPQKTRTSFLFCNHYPLSTCISRNWAKSYFFTYNFNAPSYLL